MLNSEYFVKVIEHLGIKYNSTRNQLLLTVNAFTFENSFIQNLVSDGDDKIDKHVFLESFQEFIEAEHVLKMCLLPLKSHQSGPAYVTPQDSVVKVLLNIEAIQPELSDILLEKLTEWMDENDTNHLIEMSCLILDQFRWLNALVDPTRLMHKIKEVISISPWPLQKVIIRIIPEILVDFKDIDTLNQLIEIIKENTNLLIQFVESIQNLEIPDMITKSICELIKNQINSIEIEELSIAIKFLLLSSNSSTIDGIIHSIRTELDFTSLNYLTNKPTNPTASIADALKSSFLIKEDIKTHWLKTIQSITNPKEFYSIDLIVLIIFYSIPNLKNQIKLILKKILKSNLIHFNLILNNIKLNWFIFKSYLKELISIAEFCLRTSDSDDRLGEASKAIYLAVFLNADIYYKQEVIGSLVTHFGSGTSHEIRHALDTLGEIIEKDPESSVKFTIFVKGILDYLEKLNFNQFFKLFLIYTDLILQEQINGERNFRNELEIILRKQLTHLDFKYRKFGIVAVLAMIQRLNVGLERLQNGSLDQDVGSSSSNQNIEKHPIFEYILFLINMTLSTCEKSQSLLGLFYDNLASLVQSCSVHPQIVAWIHENMASDFNHLFISETKDFFHTDVQHLQSSIWGEIESSDQSIYINILPTTVAYYETTPARPIHPSFLCSYLNLTQTCEKFLSEGKLDDINLLLTIGVKMFDMEHIKENQEILNSTKPILISSMIVCINWYRELINTFCGDKDLMGYVIQRITNVVELERYLMDEFAISLSQIKEFTPLTMDWDAPTKSKEVSKYIDLEVMRNHLRMFNIDVFFTLKHFKSYQPITIDEPTNELRECSIITQFNELLFLLINYEIYINQNFKKFCLKNNFTKILQSKEIEILGFLIHILKLVHKALASKSSDSLTLIESKLIKCIYATLDSFKNKITPPEPEKENIFETIFDSVYRFSKQNQTLNNLILYQKSCSLLYNMIQPTSTSKSRMYKLTHNILYDVKGELINKEDLNYLILEEIKFHLDDYELIKSYIENLIIPFHQTELEELTETYPHLDQNSFICYYKIMFEELTQLLNRVDVGAEVDEEFLNHIVELVTCWKRLIEVIQFTNVKPIPNIVLKNSKNFVEIFCKKIIILISSNFFKFQNEIVHIFKQLQSATRSIQNLCGETKLRKDTSVTSLIPNCRKSMEILIYEVKSVLLQNGCESAFWLGNLKHRNVNGDVVSSQHPGPAASQPQEDDDREEPVRMKSMKNIKSSRKVNLQQRKERLKRAKVSKSSFIMDEAVEEEDGDSDADDGQDPDEYDQDMIDDGDPDEGSDE